MHQDATWYGGDFVLDGDPAPRNFRPMFIIVIVISLEHCTGVRRYWFVQVQVQVQDSMHSIFRKFNCSQSARYAQLHQIATIAEVGVAK